MTAAPSFLRSAQAAESCPGPIKDVCRMCQHIPIVVTFDLKNVNTIYLCRHTRHIFMFAHVLMVREAQAAHGGKQDPEGKPSGQRQRGAVRAPARQRRGGQAKPAQWRRLCRPRGREAARVSPPLILFCPFCRVAERKRTRPVQNIDL